MDSLQFCIRPQEVTLPPHAGPILAIDSTCNREKSNFGLCATKNGMAFKWKIDPRQEIQQIWGFSDQENQITKLSGISAGKENLLLIVN